MGRRLVVGVGGGKCDGLERELARARKLTVRTFSERVGLSVATVKRMLSRRELHVFRVGPERVDAMGRDRRALRIPESEALRIMKFIPRVVSVEDGGSLACGPGASAACTCMHGGRGRWAGASAGAAGGDVGGGN